MKTKLIFSSILLVQFAISCGNKTTTPEKDKEKKESVVPEDKKPEQNESYIGTLPCNDCDGVETKLQFTNGNTGCGVFLTHTNGDMTINKRSMNTERGYEDDPDATVYILNWDKPEKEQRYFVRETGKDNILFEIDKDRKRFNDGKNHTLTKQAD